MASLKKDAKVWVKVTTGVNEKSHGAKIILTYSWSKGVLDSIEENGEGKIAKVKREGGEVVEVPIDDGKEEVDDIKLRNEGTLTSDDLTDLNNLNEPELLYHVQDRYNKSILLTHTGPVLISVNPMNYRTASKKSNEIMSSYSSKLIREASYSGFSTGADTTSDIVVENNPEDLPSYSVIVSGESGSGKTECMKSLSASLLLTGQGEESPLSLLVAEAMVLLEAFGNAKTSYSNNSSRFGNFLDLFYDTKGIPVAAAVRTYLFENVRVVDHIANERNFNVFYQLVSGSSPEIRDSCQLGGLTSKDFPYLLSNAKNSKTASKSVLELPDDTKNYGLLMESLQKLSFDKDSITHIFRCLAGILHLSRVTFEEHDTDFGVGSKISESSSPSLTAAADLLGLDPSSLEQCLVVRTIITSRGEKIPKKLEPSSCLMARDSFAKSLYDRLFLWVVERINLALEINNNPRKSFSISVLDIYGFDAFGDNNSYEQLCINYVNEALQQQFIQQIFKIEIDEYEQEGLPSELMQFDDNQDSLNLISQGIFKLLDDQCKIPMATDTRFAQQMYKDFGAVAVKDLKPRMSFHGASMSQLSSPPSNTSKLVMGMCSKFSATKTQQAQHKFCVHHFAAPCVYLVQGFIEKNMDELPGDAVELIKHSTNVILLDSKDKFDIVAKLADKLQIATPRRSSLASGGGGGLFTSPSPTSLTNLVKSEATTPTTPTNDTTPQPKMRSKSVYQPVTPNSGFTSGGAQGSKNVSSASTRFRNELSVFIKQINSTIPHYIRCVKPVAKDDDESGFNESCVIDQLRYSGVLTAVSVRRNPLRIKLNHMEFFGRYSMIVAEHQKEFTLDFEEFEENPETVKEYCDKLKDLILTLTLTPTLAIGDYKGNEGEENGNGTNVVSSIETTDLLVGNTKVFMKKSTLDYLEAQRSQNLAGNKAGHAVVVIQAEYRGYRQRKKFLRAYPPSTPSPVKKGIINGGPQVSKKQDLDDNRGNFGLQSPAGSIAPPNFGQAAIPTGRPAVSSVPSSDDLRLLSKSESVELGDDARFMNLSPYMKNRIIKYSNLDNKLLKTINHVIAVSKLNDIIQVLSLDIATIKLQLQSWTKNTSSGLLQIKLDETAKVLDYGGKMLKPEKLIQIRTIKTMGKVFSFGAKTKESNEERLKQAKQASKIIGREHKVFKNLFFAIDHVKELRALAKSENQTFAVRLKKKVDAYEAACKINGKTEAEKLTLKNILEQETTLLNRNIQLAKKVMETVLSLEEYYIKYIITFVEELGPASKFKASFADEGEYLLQLTNLIESGQPLLTPEKSVRDKSLATSQELFPLKFPNDDKHRMQLIRHLTVTAHYMPYLPGEEFLTNSLKHLMHASTDMKPIRFIKVMGRSKNNSGNFVYYQTSQYFTQTNLKDVLKSTDGVLEPEHYSASVLCSMLSGMLNAPLVSYMCNDENDGQGMRIIAFQNNACISERNMLFNRGGIAASDNEELLENTCNSLYLLPEMSEEACAPIVKYLLDNDSIAEEICASWVREVYVQNQRYSSLISSGFNATDLESLRLPAKVPAGSITFIHKALKTVQKLLRDNKSVGATTSHHDLLFALHPRTATKYAGLRRQHKTRGAIIAYESTVLSSSKTAPTMAPTMSTSGVTKASPSKARDPDSMLSAIELGQEFSALVDFNQLGPDIRSMDGKTSFYSVLADNLGFLPAVQYKGISTEQLKSMFAGCSLKFSTKDLILCEVTPEEVENIRNSNELTSMLAKRNVNVLFQE